MHMTNPNPKTLTLNPFPFRELTVRLDRARAYLGAVDRAVAALGTAGSEHAPMPLRRPQYFDPACLRTLQGVLLQETENQKTA